MITLGRRGRATLTTGIVLILGVLAGCASISPPDLGGLYSRAAREHDPMRNPVIVIPGILGSKLVDTDTDRIVWGAFTGDYANPEKPDGAALTALPMVEGEPLRDLHDDVVPNGSLDRLKVSLFGVPVELNAYLRILGTLGVGGYRDQGLGDAGAIDYGDDHYTCFQFDYDWRRDNVENAHRLHEFILRKRMYVQAELAERFGITDADVKFDIVAHSMGGLITRYMLRYGTADLPDTDGATGPEITWDGARHVERVILVGTPNAGSAEAVTQLVDGAEFAFFLPKYTPAVLGTMPSVYQLLPRPRHGAVLETSDDSAKIDILDPDVWEARGWGLADPDQTRVLEMLLPDVAEAAARRRIALDHQRKCLDRARRFFAAIDTNASTPDGLAISLIAGDAVPTAAILSADKNGAVRTRDRRPGDGTVLRSSALMDERVGGAWARGLVTPIDWEDVTFLFTDHLGLTKDPAFADNVLYQLLEAPRD